jgi:hypothetical protein
LDFDNDGKRGRKTQDIDAEEELDGTRHV